MRRLLIISLLVLVPQLALAYTWRVPSEHPAIYGAVDSAAYGDTVLVAPGTYLREREDSPEHYRCWIVMKDGVTLISEGGPEVTELVEPSPVVLQAIITCDSISDAEIRGFTIRADDFLWEQSMAIALTSSDVIVEDNVIYGPHHGIALFGEPPCPQSPIIRGNEIHDCFVGIWTWWVWASNSPQILDNHIHHCWDYGILSEDSDPYIDGNVIEHNYLSGLYFEGWTQSLLVRNKIVNNDGDGVIAIAEYIFAHPDLNHTGQKELANDIYGNSGYDVYYEEETGIGTFGATLNYWGRLIPIPTLYGNVDYVPWVDSSHTLMCHTKDDCYPTTSPTTWGGIKALYR
jgi:hypothetical protein